MRYIRFLDNLVKDMSEQDDKNQDISNANVKQEQHEIVQLYVSPRGGHKETDFFFGLNIRWHRTHFRNLWVAWVVGESVGEEKDFAGQISRVNFAA